MVDDVEDRDGGDQRRLGDVAAHPGQLHREQSRPPAATGAPGSTETPGATETPGITETPGATETPGVTPTPTDGLEGVVGQDASQESCVVPYGS